MVPGVEARFEPVQPGEDHLAQAARVHPLITERRPPAFQIEKTAGLVHVDDVKRIEQRKENHRRRQRASATASDKRDPSSRLTPVRAAAHRRESQ